LPAYHTFITTASACNCKQFGFFSALLRPPPPHHHHSPRRTRPSANVNPNSPMRVCRRARAIVSQASLQWRAARFRRQMGSTRSRALRHRYLGTAYIVVARTTPTRLPCRAACRHVWSAGRAGPRVIGSIPRQTRCGPFREEVAACCPLRRAWLS
jgi:hypothetical protein